MTAAELAKMLEGWPDGAESPHIQWGPDGFWYDGDPYGEGSRLSAELAIDLACMSGLRWIESYIDRHSGAGYTRIEHAHRTGIVKVKAYNANGTLVIGGEGPTLLHAIDAAIRATNPA